MSINLFSLLSFRFISMSVAVLSYHSQKLQQQQQQQQKLQQQIQQQQLQEALEQGKEALKLLCVKGGKKCGTCVRECVCIKCCLCMCVRVLALKTAPGSRNRIWLATNEWPLNKLTALCCCCWNSFALFEQSSNLNKLRTVKMHN